MDVRSQFPTCRFYGQVDWIFEWPEASGTMAFSGQPWAALTDDLGRFEVLSPLFFTLIRLSRFGADIWVGAL
jgi:hypothetical protein